MSAQIIQFRPKQEATEPFERFVAWLEARRQIRGLARFTYAEAQRVGIRFRLDADALDAIVREEVQYRPFEA